MTLRVQSSLALGSKPPPAVPHCDSLHDLATAHTSWEHRVPPPEHVTECDDVAAGCDGSAAPEISLFSGPPLAKLPGSLALEFVGSTQLENASDARLFANNLAAVLVGPDGAHLLVVAVFSGLFFHRFDPLTHTPEPAACLHVDVLSRAVSEDELREMTWPDDPQSWDFVKTCTGWLNSGVLAACGDGGTIAVWACTDLYAAASGHVHSVLVPQHLEPLFEIPVAGSAWGVDFASCVDSAGCVHRIVAASFNDRQAAVYYYGAAQNHVSIVAVELLPHNIPEISFVDYQVQDSIHVAVVSMACVSDQLLTYAISWRMSSGAVDVVSANMYPLATHRDPGQFWTVKPVERRFFKRVYSVRALNGDNALLPALQPHEILRQGVLLTSTHPDPQVTSSLGAAAEWQHLEVPTLGTADPVDEPSKVGPDMGIVFSNGEMDSETQTSDFDMEEFAENETATDEPSLFAEWPLLVYGESVRTECRKALCSDKSALTRSLEQKILAVTSGTSLGLFHADTLFCCARATDAIPYALIPKPRNTHLDRMQLSLVIPKISCFVAASQQGTVTIMRLCQYRGLYAMRQERVFPHFSCYSPSVDAVPLVGVSATERTVFAGSPEYFLYLTYRNGLVLTYRLLDKWDFFETVCLDF